MSKRERDQVSGLLLEPPPAALCHCQPQAVPHSTNDRLMMKKRELSITWRVSPSARRLSDASSAANEDARPIHGQTRRDVHTRCAFFLFFFFTAAAQLEALGGLPASRATSVPAPFSPRVGRARIARRPAALLVVGVLDYVRGNCCARR